MLFWTVPVSQLFDKVSLILQIITNPISYLIGSGSISKSWDFVKLILGELHFRIDCWVRFWFWVNTINYYLSLLAFVKVISMAIFEAIFFWNSNLSSPKIRLCVGEVRSIEKSVKKVKSEGWKVEIEEWRVKSEDWRVTSATLEIS